MCQLHWTQPLPRVWAPTANATPERNNMRQNGSGGGRARASKARSHALHTWSFETVRLVCPAMWPSPRLARLVLKAFPAVAVQGRNARAIVLDF
jgi:hypothetical protein